MKQVLPPSITGLEGAPAASVVDHRFGSGDPYTLGVEEEYMLLDPHSLDLVQHIETVLDAVEGDALADRINAELMQSVLEIATPVCANAGDVMRELTTLRSYVRDVGRDHGLRVGSAGTHPFSLFERQRITAKDRYRALIDQLQYVARRELIFGMHVHVAVDDPDKAIQVVNGLLPHLAPLLALSASSPFWRGEPTGLASSRQIVFSAFPRSARLRASATTPTTPPSSGSSSARAASRTTRTSGGTSARIPNGGRSRSASAMQSRGSRTRSRSRRTARRSSSSSQSASTPARRSRATTASSPARTGGSRRGTGSTLP